MHRQNELPGRIGLGRPAAVVVLFNAETGRRRVAGPGGPKEDLPFVLPPAMRIGRLQREDRPAGRDDALQQELAVVLDPAAAGNADREQEPAVVEAVLVGQLPQGPFRAGGRGVAPERILLSGEQVQFGGQERRGATRVVGTGLAQDAQHCRHAGRVLLGRVAPEQSPAEFAPTGRRPRAGVGALGEAVEGGPPQIQQPRVAADDLKEDGGRPGLPLDAGGRFGIAEAPLREQQFDGPTGAVGRRLKPSLFVDCPHRRQFMQFVGRQRLPGGGQVPQLGGRSGDVGQLPPAQNRLHPLRRFVEQPCREGLQVGLGVGGVVQRRRRGESRHPLGPDPEARQRPPQQQGDVGGQRPAVEMRAFEAASSEGVVSEVARQALPTARLSACAGVAIVKPHFPFFSAYELSEQLLKSAKSVKRHVRSGGKAFPCSAMDFHPLYDASFTDLTDIRKRLVVDDGRTRLTARPYLVSELSELPDAVTGRDWAEAHQWEGLKDRVAALGRRNSEGRQELPNSQTHDLRGALFAGRAAAEARFRLLLGRFPAFAKAAEGARLFRSAVETSDTFETRFLDAMEASEFWEGQEP